MKSYSTCSTKQFSSRYRDEYNPPNGIQLCKLCHYPFSFSTFFLISFTRYTSKSTTNKDDFMLATASFSIQSQLNSRATAPKFKMYVVTPLLEVFLLIFCSLEEKKWEMLSLPVEQLAWTYHFKSTRSSLLQGICTVSCTKMISCSTIASKLGHSILLVPDTEVAWRTRCQQFYNSTLTVFYTFVKINLSLYNL